MINQHYEIHIKGHLSRDWADWLGGLEMRWLENGEMVLLGLLPDQAALLGVLNKLNGLNLAILSVSETGRKNTPSAPRWSDKNKSEE